MLRLCRWSVMLSSSIVAIVLAEPAHAQLGSINWDALPTTEARTFEAVDIRGLGTYPANGYPVKFVGVLLNNPEDMLDSTPNFNTIPFNLGGQWQVFVQSTLANDFGGVALFLGQNFGNVPPALEFTPNPTPDTHFSFTNPQWQAQIARVNVDQATGHIFRAGDLVEVDGQGGQFFAGKTNVNTAHTGDASLEFQMRLITPSAGLPSPLPLALEDIWNDATNSVLFDTTRNAGGEHYQGSLVELLGVHVVSGTWAPNETLRVADHDGRQFPLLLGLNPGFSSITPPSGYFNVVGIFDQESNPSGPYTEGYRLWAMDPARITAVPEPSALILSIVGLVLLACRGAGRLLNRKT